MTSSMVRQRVLFLGTPFFGYYRYIIAAFEANGFEVDYLNDRPSENPFLKGLIKVRPELVQKSVQKHMRRVLDQTRGRDYDLIFVLNGKVFDRSFITALRSFHPRAESILYLWDAIDLYPHVREFALLFDRRYTFDRLDALRHPEFELLPLFYTHDYQALGGADGAEHDFDLVNVCTAHPNRYALMKTLIPSLRSDGFRIFNHLYINPLQLAYNLSKEPEFKGANLRDFKTRPLPIEAYLGALARSQAVLDVSHSAQSGLTMRTIETIGARRKLVTTNADVTKYSFYDPSRIYVLDVDDVRPHEIRAFIAAPQAHLDADEYAKLGIDHWVARLIGDREDCS